MLVPQAMAYAELAGLPALRGVLPAALAALVGAVVGSSGTLQTGPTALASLLTLGSWPNTRSREPRPSSRFAAALAIVVGAMRIMLGLMRLGQISLLLSRPVVEGLTTGAGVLIAASQVPTLVGATPVSANPLAAAADAIGSVADWRPLAVVAGVVTLAAIKLLRQWRPTWPAALLALAIGWIAAISGHAALPLGAAPTVGAVTVDLMAATALAGIVTELDSLVALVPSAVIIALVGFSESAAIARRHASPDRRPWRPTRELIGQGAACVTAGLAGGFPTSGSFSRSELNRMAGGTSRWSGVVTGGLVLLALPVVPHLSGLPRASLAAVVVFSGVSLIRPAPIVRLWWHARLQFAVAASALFATLALAPRVDIAVLVGLVLAVAAHLIREQRVHVLVHRDDGETLGVALHGVLFYLPTYLPTYLYLSATYPRSRSSSS